MMFRMVKSMHMFLLYAVFFMLVGCDDGSPYTKGVEKTADAYFRITADYTVIDTGEEINFDYVMVCGGTVTHSTYTAATVTYSKFPDTMILPTKTGEAVGIVTPTLCEAWGWRYIDKIGGKLRDPDPIPDNFMPYAMWYPDVNALGFAFGYESDLAYESPYSRLKFHGSTLKRVDQAAWWKQAAEEFESISGLPGPWGLSYSQTRDTKEIRDEIMSRNQGLMPAGRWCNAVAQIDLPERFADRAEQIAEENDFDFWVADNGDDSLKLLDDIRKSYDYSFNGGRYQDHLLLGNGLGVRKSDGKPTSTKPIRAIDGTVSTRVVAVGGGRIIVPDGQGNFYHDVYPVVKGDLSISATHPSGEFFYSNITLIKPEWNGFGICSVAPVNYTDVLTYAERRSNALPVDYAYSYEEKKAVEHRSYFNVTEVNSFPNDLIGTEISFDAFDKDGHVYPRCCNGG